jgi:tetratricopeptide (TPR) repeat protein
MSLINQMLRDLESRRGGSSSRPVPVPGAEPEPVGRTAGKRRLGLLLVAGLALSGLVWAALDRFPGARSTPLAVAVLSTPAVVPLPSVPPQDPPVMIGAPGLAVEQPATDQPVAPVVPETAALSDPPAGELTGAVVEPPAPGLLARRAAVRMVTLLDLGLLETGDSSRLVLEFERIPEYRVVRDGSSGKLLQLLFSATGIGASVEIPQLQGALMETLSLVPEQRDLLLTVGLRDAVRLQELKLPADAFHGQRLVLDLQQLPPIAESPQPVRREPAVAPSGASPVASSARKKMSKTEPLLSREGQALQAYRDGLEQLERGQTGAAENNFARALTLQPQLLAARLEQIGLMVRAGRRAEAEQLLLSGIQGDPASSELRKTYARWLLNEQQVEKAIGVLDSEPLPEIAADLEYHALLAALLQESGRFAEAAGRYEKLLAVRPREALWWLGLAITREQSGALAAARQAYQQALASPGLRPDLAEYSRSRLEVL